MTDTTRTTEAAALPAIIRLPEVLQIVGLSRPSIYRLMKLGEFPRQVKLGQSSVGWMRAEVAQWIACRMEARPCYIPPPPSRAARIAKPVQPTRYSKSLCV